MIVLHGPPRAESFLFVMFMVFVPIISLLQLWLSDGYQIGQRFIGGASTKNDPSLLALEVEVRKARLRKELKSLETEET